jgi:hypothetical protein
MTDNCSNHWLRVTDHLGNVVFDCVHQGTPNNSWLWAHGIVNDDLSNVINGEDTLEDLCNQARRSQVAHGGSVVSGALLEEFNETWN